jgi:hypothetical protein
MPRNQFAGCFLSHTIFRLYSLLYTFLGLSTHQVVAPVAVLAPVRAAPLWPRPRSAPAGLAGAKGQARQRPPALQPHGCVRFHPFAPAMQQHIIRPFHGLEEVILVCRLVVASALFLPVRLPLQPTTPH